nr:reverse transcriptase domain-containing protein [Tanacetum cinerariifolium]
MANSRDRSHIRGRPPGRDSSPSRDRPRSRDCLCGIEESYGNPRSSYRTWARHRYHSRDRDRSRSMKRERESESSLSCLSKSGTRDEGHWKSKSKRRNLTDPVEIYNIKQREGEAIEDFIKRLKLKKQIEELVREGKLSHLIKEIKQGRDPPKVGKKEVPAKDKEITFPPLATSMGTEGPLIIKAEISGYMIHRMYVNEGSSMEVLYKHCFNQLRPEIKSQMVPATTSLTGFSGEIIWPLGQLRLLVIIGDAEHLIKAWMNFMVVRSLSPYSGIIGRPKIREIQAVPSTVYGMLKFPVDGGIVTICSTILIPTECTTMTTASTEILKEAEVHHENFKVVLHPNFSDQEVAIGRTLSVKGRMKLCSLLKENLDVFAWQPSDMPGVSRSVAEHRLNIQKGYLPMAQSDKEKMAFRTDHGVYFYTKMPFGLKNAGATYQRLVSQVGRNIEVYIDDLVIKSHTKTEMLRDIDETFYTLQKINMKLNPKKYTFETVEGMFLGFMILPEGIKPCQDKTKAVLQLPSPQTIKEVQSLNGKLASLNRLLSKSVKKSLPLFKTLKKCIKKSAFHWTPEAEQAFKQLKQHLSELPMLVASKPKEELIVYMSAFNRATGVVLMTERDTVQMPVYFLSHALQGPELNYTPMEKLVLALVFAAKRLRRYFQAHPIAVITDQPIKQIISRPYVARRLQKCSVMLEEHNITYQPRTSVKGQILADFLVEKPNEAPPDTSVVKTRKSHGYYSRMDHHV